MQSALETAKNRDHKSAGPKPAGPSPSAPASFNPILTLQQQAGNQAVQELLRQAGIQAKLSISNPGDPEEREADQVAERIMRSHAADVSSSCSCSENEEQCEECKQKQSSTVSRKGANAFQMQSASPQSAAFAGPHAADSAAELSLLGSDGGHPLDPQSRSFFESRFNHDFSKVRLHTGGDAAESARSIQALAYTTGNHIAFAASQYQPSTEQGQKLLAHELTHVVQQRGASNKLERIADSSQAVESTDRTNSSRKSSGRAPAEGDAITQPAIQRKVANVNCPANAAGAPADPRKDLEGADVKAVELTKQMAADLATDAETVKGGIPAVPSSSLQSFENHFGLPIAQGKGFLNRLTGQVRPTQEIALSEELSLVSRRFNLVLRLLGQGLSYICPGNHTVSLVGCAPGACPVGDSFSCPSNSLVGLCETFWTSTDETGRAQMIVHEGFHIVFPGVLDATTLGPGRNFNIDGCYEALLEDRTGSQTSTCPDPPNQAPPAPGNQGAQAPQNPAVQPKLASSGSGNVLRKGAGTDSQEMESANQVSAAVSMLHGDNGQPLDGSARAFFEPRFGRDFSDVRVHTSGQAAQSAESIQALAYTAGRDIVFDKGQFAPETRTGRLLLAHELTHVVQQESGRGAVVQRDFAGCKHLIPENPYEDWTTLLSGIAAHALIQQDFAATVPTARKKIGIPGAYANPLRTAGLCGLGKNEVEPQVVGAGESEQSKARGGKGFPDLASVDGNELFVGEIKPAVNQCLVDGEKQLDRYITHGNARDDEAKSWRGSEGIRTVWPMPPDHYLPPKFSLLTAVGDIELKSGWCKPGLLGYAVSLTRERRREREGAAEPKKEKKTLEKPARVKPTRTRIVAWDPNFEDFANRLNPGLAPPGHDFVIAVPEHIYRQIVDEMNRRRLVQTRRLMQIDPRGVPLIKAESPLLPIAAVVGATEVAVSMTGIVLASTAGAAAVAGPVAAQLPIGGEVGAGAGAISATTSTGTTLTLIQGGGATASTVGGAAAAATGTTAAATGSGVVEITMTKAAAAIVVAKLIHTVGISEAQAAEALKPMIGKPIMAVIDVTGQVPAKPGQPVGGGGNVYRAVVLLKGDQP